VNRFEAHDIALARRKELTERIQRFVDGTDVSVESVALIEAGLDDAFPDNDWMSAQVLMLASYRPGGGESFYDEAQVRAELVKVLARLRQS
jgi:hypothetical protein